MGQKRDPIYRGLRPLEIAWEEISDCSGNYQEEHGDEHEIYEV